MLDVKNKLLHPNKTGPVSPDDDEGDNGGGGDDNDDGGDGSDDDGNQSAQASPSKTAKEVQNETDDRKKV